MDEDKENTKAMIHTLSKNLSKDELKEKYASFETECGCTSFKGDRMRIDMEEVAVHKAKQALWNSVDISEVEIYKNGELYTPDEAEFTMLRMTGFSNVDVIHELHELDDAPDTTIANDGPFNGIVPNDLKEAVDQILASLTPANIEDIKNMGTGHAQTCLDGMAIRNEWRLWYKSPLSMWFAGQEIYHADDMSATICKAVWRNIKGSENYLYIEEDVEYYKWHWERAKVDVKANFEERCAGSQDESDASKFTSGK